MTEEDWCPVCFDPYTKGRKRKYGKSQSKHYIIGGCNHQICYECCITLGKQNMTKEYPVVCPLCREDWKIFIVDALKEYDGIKKITDFFVVTSLNGQ